MIKKLKKVALLGLVIGALLSLGACGKELDCPTGLSVDIDNKLTWTEVENARNYEIEITDVATGEVTSKTSRRASYSLSKLAEGDYEIRLKAIGGGSSGDDSDWTEIFYFHKNYETGCLYELITPTEYAIKSDGSARGTVYIEDVYRGKPVTSILENAFKNNTAVENIVFGKNIERIEKGAFYNCKKLISVTLPDSLTYIGEAAFQNCYLLSSIVIPDNVSEISMNAFHSCQALESIDFGDSVTTIGESAFYKCSALTELVIPESVETLGLSAFENCEALDTVTIGSNVTTLGENAFYKCVALETVTFKGKEEISETDAYVCNLKTIGKKAFSECSSLSEIILPNGVETIEDSVFYKCVALVAVEIPDSVMRVGAYAFDASKLYVDAVEAGDSFIYADDWLVGVVDSMKETITLLDETTLKSGVVGIADNVFMGCENLEDVMLPGTVRAIGKWAFSGNQKLYRFQTPENSALKLINRYAFTDCTALSALVISNGLETIENYAFYGCSGLDNSVYAGNSIIPASVKYIGTYAFKNTKLWNNPDQYGVVYAGNWVVGFNGLTSTSITLKSTTVGIANYAFYQCEELRQVIGLNYAKYIGRAAFYECTNLTTVSLGVNVTKIEEFTFYKCSSLFSIGEELPPRLKEIGRSAFYKCTKLNALDLSDGSIEKIGNYAFYGCLNIKTIDLGKDLISIGENAFNGCASLTEVVLPETVKEIGYRAFYKCEDLQTLTLNEQLTSIGDFAFYKCIALEKISIPDSVKTIGNSAFYGCTGVYEVQLGNGVETIGTSAFANLQLVTELKLPESLKSVGNYAFKGWNGLTSLIIPGSIEQIGENAFYTQAEITIYTDATVEAADTWNDRWNSSYRPVVWGCTLSEDKTYVVSVTIGENTISNPQKIVGFGEGEDKEYKYVDSVTAPHREGYDFVGWATTADATVAEYEAEKLYYVPAGTTVYAIWAPSAVN